MTYLYPAGIHSAPGAQYAPEERTRPRTVRNWRAALRGLWNAPMPEAFADPPPISPAPPIEPETSTESHDSPAALASVTFVPPGLPDDGMVERQRLPNDRGRSAHAAQMGEALEAWRTNPLARRLVALVTSTCVGDGIRLSSSYAPLEDFIRAFWNHPQNHLDDELAEWSDELSRSGELFLALFTDPATGMSYVRAVPAAQIADVHWQKGDYRTELAYRDVGATDGASSPLESRWWKSPAHPEASALEPVMLHFAINRPVGAVRGESDLAPILHWLRRYTRWLEDRVILNASTRSFLWIVNAPKRLRGHLLESYRQPPQPGSVIFAEEDEKWTAVAPNLHAADAEMDGRAIRWMVAAGGPGTALIDLGEGEDANLATGAVMQEQKRRFLRRRQRVLVQMLVNLTLEAFRRYVEVTGAPVRAVAAEDIVALTPDISPEDNASLATAAAQIVAALQGMGEIAGSNEEFRRMALRLFARFAGESITAAELDRILAKGEQA